MNTEITRLAVSLAGGPKKVGDQFGISSQAVSQWDVIPWNRVLIMEELSGIPRHKLRPDIYPQTESA